MLDLTLCANWIYILEGGESAIMFHIPPVVCVSWGLGAWHDVSHTYLPSHNRRVKFHKDSNDTGEHQDYLPSDSTDEDLHIVQG